MSKELQPDPTDIPYDPGFIETIGGLSPHGLMDLPNEFKRRQRENKGLVPRMGPLCKSDMMVMGSASR